MITESVYAKREIDEKKRNEDFKEINRKVIEYFADQEELKKSAGEIVEAMRSRKTLELTDANEDAYLIAVIYYYITTRQPIVIATGSVSRRVELIKKVRKMYRSITGEKAKVLGLTGEKAEVLVVQGVEDFDLDPTDRAFAYVKVNSIINDCITFCDQDFLIRDFQREPDEYDITYRLFSAKYDIFVVADADNLNESAALADAKHWDHMSCRHLLDDMLFYAQSLNLDEAAAQVTKAKKCLSDLMDQMIDSGVQTIEYAAFAPLKDAMAAISIPPLVAPVTEWGSFYSKERQANQTMMGREMVREMDALEAIVAGTDADSLTIRHRLGKHAYAPVITAKTKTRGAYYNTFVCFAKDAKAYDGAAQLKELIGSDPDLSLVLAN
ncbi:MAG: hypothetical protein LUG54_09495 [Clostridiales bacterium]|nr:hypothetical protein [Clostridiales bacterium]